MPDSPLLPGPRHDWLGRLLDVCSSLPGLGGIFARAQRVRRKRFRARLNKCAGFRQQVSNHPTGQAFQKSLSRWLEQTPHPHKLQPLVGTLLVPRVRCSVIINTVDRADDLALTLADLAPQWRADLDELVIVLGPASGESRGIIAQSNLPCQIIDCPERNLAISRNLGLSAAAGEFVAFLDDDASPCNGWLDALLEPLAQCPSAGASAGFALDGEGTIYLTRYVVSDRLGRATWWENEEEAHNQIAEAGPDRAFLTATGCNMAFRRDRLLAFGGFDPSYAYFLEETDLVLRLHEAGHPCLPCPGSVVRHRQAANAARSPDASIASRRIIVRSQLHFIRKFGIATSPRAEIETCVWLRILADLERIGWDHPDKASTLQTAYLTGTCEDMSCGDPVPDLH